MSLLRHEVTVEASFSCPRLVFGWSGLFLACFSVLGLDCGFLGLGKSPGKALENWLGEYVSDSGLILGFFSGIWLWNMPGPVRNVGGGLAAC